MDRDALAGRVAVVTGAAGTMGRAACAALHAAGCRIGLIDCDAGALERCARELAQDAGAPLLHAVACDVGDPDQVATAHAALVDALGPVDILVNNAGRLTKHKAEATSAEDWHATLAANLDGALYWAQCTMGTMRTRGWGRIVNVTSLAAKTGGLTAGTAYAASKGALSALTFSLARELAAHGVTVNAIAPAYVRTPMVTEQLDAAQRDALLKQIPVGRFCEPEEFAHAVLFLVSPLAGFVTGEILDLNGGLLMD
jgi:3-oxoacyl-[acyl-carrier protein] reductase